MTRAQQATPEAMRSGLDRGLVAALAVALVLRIVWGLVVPVDPVSDSVAYQRFALTLVEHGVFGWAPDEPTAFLAVGTSAIIAAAYALFGTGSGSIVVLNIIASLGFIFFTARLGALYFGRTAGLAAAWLLALWPNLIFFVSIISSELFFLFLATGGLYFWTRSSGRPILNLILCGLFWGGALYVRPVILLLPVALACASLVRGGSWSAPLRAAGVIALILALAAPWTLRNKEVFGEPVLISTNFGPTFWMGNNPESDGVYMEPPAWTAEMSEAERARALKEDAMAHVRAEPGLFVRRTLSKALQLHERETIGVAWNEPSLIARFGSASLMPLKAVATGYWYAALLLALVGAGLLVARTGLVGLFHPTIVSWGYFTMLHAIIVSGDRYHMPNVPFIALLAGLAIVELLRWRANAGRIELAGNEPNPTSGR
jgi:4-amino-4-deoxy-L-arabinose transferase-like glycosyltransferase